MLSITTDYARDTGDPEPYLRRIAVAGFTHVHWCHHWCTDFLYAAPEIRQISRWLKELRLGVLDLHASAGQEKNWASAREYERQAGVALVRNRLEMTARLGGDVIILHVPGGAPDDVLRRSLAALETASAKCGVRVALENGDFAVNRRLLGEYGPEFLGLCYDSGHGNLCQADGLAQLETLRDRLLAVHLHDNDGASDQHKLPFTGTIDWPRLTRILARSAYRKCISLETIIKNTGLSDETLFLGQAREAGLKLTAMVEAHRAERSGP